MKRFLERHRDQILGVLSGFDRVLFRGTVRSLEYLDGVEAFLAVHQGACPWLVRQASNRATASRQE
jgi:hypothetical protein